MDDRRSSAPPMWQPTPERVSRANLTAYQAWLEREHGQSFADYHSLWQWSVTFLDGFWRSIWEYFQVSADGSPDRVLGVRTMPGAAWFPDVQLSFPEHVFRDRDAEAIAIRHASEGRPLQAWTWGTLRRETARIRAGLAALGVRRGDRVAAYLPNLPETVAAFLATASLGATWSCAAPEFGARAVIDRFAQIEPTVLLAVDGYRYGGRDFDRREQADEVAAAVGGRLVRLGHLHGTGWEEGFLPGAPPPLSFARVPFDHPLWILYSSGTTGLPKPIVHGHGGILLELLKQLHLHLDTHSGDRVLWFTTTGWMMWNFLVGVLLTPASIVLYDGSPAHPNLDALWELAEQAGVTTFGTSAGYLSACAKAGVRPRRGRDLGRLEAVGSTGSPLAPEGFDWVYDELGKDTWLFSTSGGTDVCTAFLGGVPTLPVYRGELQARALGCRVESWDEQGRPHVGRVGELVITAPMPSMPTGFWGDADGHRYAEAYFSTYPGVWRHGDWVELTERGTAILYGRSDSTINRGGVRMGTSEIYRAVLALPEVIDALVVDLPEGSPTHAGGWMPLFVVLRDGAELDQGLRTQITGRIRKDCSPRHVPDDIIAVAEVPRTLSGKILEVPVKRILAGEDPDQVLSRGALANPHALDPFLALAQGGCR
ncbi:MAG: acetoacetate--CoA ligase [Solirubrobacteraceae bacterium]